MSRRSLAALIAGAAAAMACYFLAARPPGIASYLIFYLGTPAVAVAFLAAGLAAWLRWPGSRLGLLFGLVGYFTLLPALDYLDDPAGFTIGNAALPLAGAALAHPGLAWPTGRLRSRFERGVVVAEYASAAGFSLLAMLFWDPAFSGCDARCPANLLLVRGSRPAWDAINETGAAVSVVLTVIVVTLIIRHWRSARGWSRRAMVPLVWIAVAIGAESVITNVTGLYRLPPLANLVFNGWAPLVSLLGPVLFVISTVRARTARGALGTAIVDLEPGASPGRLRDTLARALGDSTLQLAFRDRDGFTDTSGLAVDPVRPDPGRAVVPLTGAREAVLVYDAGLDLEPHLIRLTTAAASMALEHSRLQAEVQAQLELVRASRSRIVEAVLTETGLAGAIQALVERSPAVVTITEVPRERFPAVIEATAYFVVSEALANVAKHAMAGTAQVSIRRLPGRLSVRVSDDGSGGARPERGSGLAGLTDRVASAGGVLRLDSPPGAGTRLEADIPCP